MSEAIDIQVTIVHHTEAAVLVDDGDREAWLPKAEIDWDDEYTTGDVVIFNVPEWLAIDKELA